MNNDNISKTRVFHLISGDLWAGAESMVFNLLSHLRESTDLDLAVIILNEGRLAEDLRGIGMAVYVIDEKQHSFWEIVRRAREVMRTSPPDLIHSHRYKENLLATLTSGLNGKSTRLIATQHGLPESNLGRRTLAGRFISKANFRLLARYFTKTVAVSADIKNSLLKQHSFCEESVETIHNGVEIPETTMTTKKRGTVVIGSSGRLFPVKDYPLMIKIASSIASTSSHDIRFELAGDGPLQAALETMIQLYGLKESFILKGHLGDMDAFYHGMDIYLNTSLHEGIPMTILEALARGIPVVAPAVGGISEIITNGVDGFLIKDRKPEAFAEKCLLLSENRELRESMSKAARLRAESAFSAKQMAGKYYRLYQQAGEAI